MNAFLSFLSELQNPEKTRNFNVFKNYSLDEFSSILDLYKDHIQKNDFYSPFRFSVVGTNGKGSTSFYLSELLRRMDPSAHVGLYTSPHLITPFERIICNGETISNIDADRILEALNLTNDKQIQKLSYFECLTLLSFCYFKNKKCKYEVWEAGLGGRLDATKLALPDAIVLTKIGLDHSEILGNTLESIASEKLHIASSNSKMIYSFPVEGKLKSHISNIANEFPLQIKYYEGNSDPNYLKANFDFSQWVLRDLNLLKKEHSFSFEDFARPKGRLETISKQPHIIFDPAHNPDAVKHTLSYIKSIPGWDHAVLLIGSLPDKDTTSIWKEIGPHSFSRILFYEGEGFFKWSKILPDSAGKFLRTPPEIRDSLQDKQVPVLVLGSFRLYPILTSLYQNDVIS